MSERDARGPEEHEKSFEAMLRDGGPQVGVPLAVPELDAATLRRLGRGRAFRCGRPSLWRGRRWDK